MSHYALPLFALLAISGCLELPGTTEPESTDPADTATPAGCGAADPSVLSTTGCIEGSSAGTIESFLGVPYAEPPVGDLRFKKTVPIAAWSGPLDAGEVGPMCVQGENPLTFDDDAAEGSEDCLTLNVLRPAGTQPGDSLPILFFTHGGNFSFGSFSFGNFSFGILVSTL